MNADDPRHGRRAGYVAGCREDDCRAAHTRYQKQAALRRLKQGSQYADRAFLDAIVARWEPVGVSANALAVAAGVAGTAITGRYPKVELDTLAAVAGVTWDNLPDTALVYGDLTRRRVWSLGAGGHPVTHTCRMNGLDINGPWRKSTRVNLGLARKIMAYYQSMPDRGPSKQAVTMATRQGHLPPIAWDDPGVPAMPLGWTPDQADGIDQDPVVIDRICSGDWRLSANLAERIAVLERWQAAGLADNEVERRTGWNVARDIRPHLRSKDAA